MKNILAGLFLIIGYRDCTAQTDTLKINDLNSIHTIITSELRIPDSFRSKPVGETVLLEIHMKDNRVQGVEIWHNQSTFLYTACQIIVDKLKNTWIPQYKFPQTIYYPVCINFITDPPNKEQNAFFAYEVLSKLKELQTEHFLFAPGSVISYSAKSLRRSTPLPYKAE
jgi:hypothetical protein